MDLEKSVRTSSNLAQWFEMRGLSVGSFAFIMNRISGLGLTFYLFLHLVVLSQLARGPQAYDDFVAIVKNPVFVFGEFVVVAGVLLHGFNGLRVAMTSMGIGVPFQKRLFFLGMAVALAGCVVFAVRMFGGEG